MNKTILITGGSGSLGSELVAQLIEDNTVGKIIIYSRGEHRQEEMMRQYKDHVNYTKLRFFIGDVRDKDRLMLACTRVDIIIHTAAMKVVTLSETNPFECVKTNILGTQNVIDAALYDDVEKVMFVSTDKAVDPINLYGFTKATAEKMILASNNIKGPMGTCFCVVAYGNVANSNGSVIPLFAKLYKESKEFPITDPRMTRFYITLENAAKFVIDCALTKHNPGKYIPEMKAFDVIDLCGAFGDFKKDSLRDWPYKIVGIRPGEKLHETMGENINSEHTEKMSVEELRNELIRMGHVSKDRYSNTRITQMA
jgi:UDP-N-acetylglucosamine 4,6-dehydratase/5-epimerase